MMNLRLNPEWLKAKAGEEDGVSLSVGGLITKLAPLFDEASEQADAQTAEMNALDTRASQKSSKIVQIHASSEPASAVPVFGQFLNLSRREKGWSVQQLAGKLDVAVESVVRLENGQFPQPMLVSKIAKVFQLPPKNLLQIAGHATAEKNVADAAFAFAARSNSKPLDADQRAALKEFVKALASN